MRQVGSGCRLLVLRAGEAVTTHSTPSALTAIHASTSHARVPAGPFGYLWLIRMADGPYSDEATGRGDPVYQGWPGLAHADGLPPILDLSFGPGMLHTVRARIRACASRAGFGEDQTQDVVLAVHELAANVIRHDGETGRLRVWDLPGALSCQVDDGVAAP